MMRGPADTLSAELLGPDQPRRRQPFLVPQDQRQRTARAVGRPDFRPWVDGMPEQLAGQSTISGLSSAPGELQVDQSKISVQNFAAKVGQTQIDEQGIEAAGDFRWETATRQFASKAYQLSSSSIAFGTRDVLDSIHRVGPAACPRRRRLPRRLRSAHSLGDLLTRPAASSRAGQFVGRLQLASDAQRATATLTATAEPLQLVNSADGSIAWNEPKVELATVAAYANADDRLQLTDISLTGNTVKMQGSGVVEQLKTAGWSQ